MMKAYENTINDAFRKPNSNEISTEINKLIQSLTNEK